MRRLDLEILATLVCCVLCAMCCVSCLDEDSGTYNDDYLGNFEACWQAMDEHYCFFDEKGVDWDDVYREYKPLFRDSVTSMQQCFNLMGQMIAIVRDGHVNLYTPFNTARYWKWYQDYPHNYNNDLVLDYYLKSSRWIVPGFMFQMLKDSVAYVRYESFSNTPGSANIDYMLGALSRAKGLILDIRDNGGGSLTNVPLIAQRFMTSKTLYGYVRHKTGKGHSEFSDYEPMYIEPVKDRVLWDATVQPVAVLTNRHTYSAANNFTQAIKAIAQQPTVGEDGVSREKMIVTVGDQTGGGGGMPFETVLPNGWVLRFSACPIVDHKKALVEEGIAPDIKVDMDSVNVIEKHRDDIIERARAYINQNTKMIYKDNDEDKK